MTGSPQCYAHWPTLGFIAAVLTATVCIAVVMTATVHLVWQINFYRAACNADAV